jgi:hypothetical protein
VNGLFYFKGIRIKQMAIVKKKRGRPAGSGHGQQVVHKLRHGFEGALAELDARGKSLPELLADALEADVNGTIRSMAALLPRDVDISVNAGDTLGDALAQIQVKLSERKRGEIIEAEFSEADSQKDE